MFQILHDMQWSPEWNVTKHNRHIADVRDCADERCIVGKLGMIVKHPDYPGYPRSLNTLQEYLIDWFAERWGKKIEIYVRGAEAIRAVRPDLMEDIKLATASAFDHVAKFAPIDSCAKDEAWGRIKIVFCFS